MPAGQAPHASTSPVWNPVATRTLALAMFALSGSETVTLPSTVVAGSPSPYAVDPPEVVTVGAVLALVRSIVRVGTFDAAPLESVIWNDTVFEPDGFALTFSYLTD